MHEGIKFRCNECDYQATQKSHLTSHQQSLHRDRKYDCPDCDYQATDNSNLIKHRHYTWVLNISVNTVITRLQEKII